MTRVYVLMAGGKSERLWPKSRAGLPKQFLDLTGSGRTMIQKTADRLASVARAEDIYIVTNRDYVNTVTDQLPFIPRENILGEPLARNTAPCVAYASGVLRSRYEDAVMAVLPSDHLIENDANYLRDLNAAMAFAEKADAIVTIGITPSYPETGYGYIHYDREAMDQDGFCPVHRFVEKPAADLAEEYLKSGEYLWNSGMFIWRLSLIIDLFKQLMPTVHEGLQAICRESERGCLDGSIDRIFEAFPSISIDFGILEKADAIYTIPSTFGWLDIGGWNAIASVHPKDENGNICLSDTLAWESSDNIVDVGPNRLTALLHVNNLVVVNTEDALLVASRDRLDAIKSILKKLGESGRESLL